MSEIAAQLNAAQNLIDLQASQIIILTSSLNAANVQIVTLQGEPILDLDDQSALATLTADVQAKSSAPAPAQTPTPSATVSPVPSVTAGV